jgi:hypothetical protein
LSPIYIRDYLFQQQKTWVLLFLIAFSSVTNLSSLLPSHPYGDAFLILIWL